MQSILEKALAQGALEWWPGARARAAAGGEHVLAELFPALARRAGTASLGGGLRSEEVGSDRPARADLDAWRLCDAAGLVLIGLARAGGEALIDLFQHGDFEERTIVLRALCLLPVSEATIALLGEAQRTNVENHFAAAACDSNLPARAALHPSFGLEGFNRLVLKAAFLQEPVSRLLEVETRANPELTRMLQDLASEREAAGRAVWPGTNLLIAFAPIEGTAARLVGGLEHGDDVRRRSAAEGLAVLNQRDLQPFIRERLRREPRAEIRAALERALRS